MNNTDFFVQLEDREKVQKRVRKAAIFVQYVNVKIHEILNIVEKWD
jgi:hypothetical protein